MKVFKNYKLICIFTFFVFLSNIFVYSIQQQLLEEKDVIKVLEKIKNYFPKKGYNGNLINNNNILIYVKDSPVKNFNRFSDEFLEYGIELKQTEIDILGRIMNYIAKNAFKFRNKKIDLYLFYKNLNIVEK